VNFLTGLNYQERQPWQPETVKLL